MLVIQILVVEGQSLVPHHLTVCCQRWETLLEAICVRVAKGGRNFKLRNGMIWKNNN
jgi:hypothetical protein